MTYDKLTGRNRGEGFLSGACERDRFLRLLFSLRTDL